MAIGTGTTTTRSDFKALGERARLAGEKAVDAMARFTEAIRDADPQAVRIAETAEQRARAHKVSREAVIALADFLILRDWPSATPRQIVAHRINTYRALAAAALNGEAWAIRKAWPEAMSELYGTRQA